MGFPTTPSPQRGSPSEIPSQRATGAEGAPRIEVADLLLREPLQVDLRTLFENDLQGGPVEVQTSATGTVPDDTPFLGGSGFSLDVTLVNSFDPPPDDPLLDQCAAYLP